MGHLREAEDGWEQDGKHHSTPQLGIQGKPKSGNTCHEVLGVKPLGGKVKEGCHDGPNGVVTGRQSQRGVARRQLPVDPQTSQRTDRSLEQMATPKSQGILHENH